MILGLACLSVCMVLTDIYEYLRYLVRSPFETFFHDIATGTSCVTGVDLIVDQ